MKHLDLKLAATVYGILLALTLLLRAVVERWGGGDD